MLTALAHESDLAGGIANHNGIRRNIPDDYRTRPDECVAANGHTADDRGIRSDRRAFINVGCDELIAALLDLGTRIEVVGENCVRAYKYVIAKGNAVPYGYAVFYGHAITDHDVRFNEGMIADVAMLTDDRASHNMSESPDPGAFANDLRFDQGLRMNEVGSGTHGPSRCSEK